MLTRGFQEDAERGQFRIENREQAARTLLARSILVPDTTEFQFRSAHWLGNEMTLNELEHTCRVCICFSTSQLSRKCPTARDIETSSMFRNDRNQFARGFQNVETFDGEQSQSNSLHTLFLVQLNNLGRKMHSIFHVGGMQRTQPLFLVQHCGKAKNMVHANFEEHRCALTNKSTSHYGFKFVETDTHPKSTKLNLLQLFAPLPGECPWPLQVEDPHQEHALVRAATRQPLQTEADIPALHKREQLGTEEVVTKTTTTTASPKAGVSTTGDLVRQPPLEGPTRTVQGNTCGWSPDFPWHTLWTAQTRSLLGEPAKARVTRHRQ